MRQMQTVLRRPKTNLARPAKVNFLKIFPMQCIALLNYLEIGNKRKTRK